MTLNKISLEKVQLNVPKTGHEHWLQRRPIKLDEGHASKS